jgi:Domain of unknown function (DUF4383)
MATAAGRTGGTRTPAQTFALVFGAIYLLIGLVGFAVTGFDNFATGSTDELIIFHLNPLHNLVHIAIGAVWIGAASDHAKAKSVNTAIGVVYLLVALLGFLHTPDKVMEWLNIHSASDPDNFLHLVSGAAGVFFGTAGAEGGVSRAPVA